MPPTIQPARFNLDKKLVVEEHVVKVMKPYFVDVPVERPVIHDVEYERPVIVDKERIVEIPVDRIVYKDVVVERPIWKDVIVERVTYKDVVIERPVYVDRVVNVPQVTIREETKVVPKILEKEEIKYKFVDRTVEVPVWKKVVVEHAIFKNSETICPRCGGPGSMR